MGIHVLGTGSYTPEFQVTNDDMAKIVETNDEWIRTRTGIGTRHISDGEPTWYMGVQAAKRAIEAAGIDPAEIGLLIDTTQNAKVAEDARAYRAGRLIYGKVTLAAGAALTAANLLVLRKQGLVFDRMEETGTFDNEKKG